MGEIIRRFREKFGYSQAEVAAYLGVSRQTYIKYESGEIEPSLRSVKLLKRLFKVSYDEIIDGNYDSCENSKNESILEETSHAYTVNQKKSESSFEKKYCSLPLEMRKIVSDLMDSLSSAMEGAEAEKRVYRTPGGLDGKLWMSEDFDETPDCFSDYM